MFSIPELLSLELQGEANDVQVYSYQFLDDLSFLRRPEDVFEDEPSGSLFEYMEQIKARLRDAGWEGDGRLGILWFPPFVDLGIEDTWGTYAWCVKQYNNGTAWIASNAVLPFKRLIRQNEWLPYETHLRAGLMAEACMSFSDALAKIIGDLTRRTNALALNNRLVFQEIQNEILVGSQGELVAQFIRFLDDCYLDILDEVIANGNTSKLRLSKFKAAIELKQYLRSDDFNSEDMVEENTWLTMRGLIRDIWISYQFEPFQQKLSMLFNACEFPTDSPEVKTVRIHVQLRNCIQHHERRLTQEAAQSLGVDGIEIQQDGSPAILLRPNDRIEFSIVEVTMLGTAMAKVAKAFYEHTTRRIRRKVWLSQEHSVRG